TIRDVRRGVDRATTTRESGEASKDGATPRPERSVDRYSRANPERWRAALARDLARRVPHRRRDYTTHRGRGRRARRRAARPGRRTHPWDRPPRLDALDAS